MVYVDLFLRVRGREEVGEFDRFLIRIEGNTEYLKFWGKLKE